MKRIFLFLIGFILFVQYPASAEMVRYIDENGKVHYVNPDVVKIPEKYLPQVKSQLGPPEEMSPENILFDTATDPGPVPDEKDIKTKRGKLEKGTYIPGNSEYPDAMAPQYYPNQVISVRAIPPAPKRVTPRVDLFTSKDCLECDDLQQALIANQIAYKKYDVTYSSYGKRVYQNQGGKLPIVRIGSQTFHTTNINDIKIILEEPAP